MKQRYTGSCHCGDIRFECQLNLAGGTSRCNCSICSKSRFWKTIVPGTSFQLLQGADELTSYRFGSNSIEHLFCKHCGIKTFGKGHLEELGGEFYAVNVTCLDGLTPAQLAQLTVQFEDGLHDDWPSEPVETRYL